MKLIKMRAVQWGYSDIRMWPCYMILCITTLIYNRWLGLFWATLLIGLPAFALSMRLFKLYDPTKAPVKEAEILADIARIVKEYEENNYLLRRNMKIIQEEEDDIKEMKTTISIGLSKVI